MCLPLFVIPPAYEIVSQLGRGGFSLPYTGSTKVEPTLYCDVNENNTSYDTASTAGRHLMRNPGSNMKLIGVGINLNGTRMFHLSINWVF